MTINLLPIPGIDEVEAGDDVAQMITTALASLGEMLRNGDILVVTHKIVSKAEGAVVRVDPADPDSHALVVEQEAVRVLRRRGDLRIAVTRHGFICANAGVDRSNVPSGFVVLLPVDPDRSAHRIRNRLEREYGCSVGVIISDTFGRTFRRGVTDVAIGVSGVPAIVDLRGTLDHHGVPLRVTEVAVADEIAAAADLAMGKASKIPVVLVRGLELLGEGRASDLVRSADHELFR